MNIDLRPIIVDITLCKNDLCLNKCKRYYKLYKPSERQSYILPSIEYDKLGNQKPCKVRMEWLYGIKTSRQIFK